jgi:hypothetical protein
MSASGSAVLLLIHHNKTQMAREARCAHNVAFLSYLADRHATHRGRLPSAREWIEQLEEDRAEGPRLQTALFCPSTADLPCGYAFNAALDGISPDGIEDPARTVVFLESELGWNASGGPEALPDVPRHRGGDNYGFADGHDEWIKRSRFPDGTWAKEPDADWVIWEPVLKDQAGEADRPSP